MVDAAPASVLSDMTIETKPTASPKEAVADDAKRTARTGAAAPTIAAKRKAPAKAALETQARSTRAAPAKSRATAKHSKTVKGSNEATVEGVRISNPERVIDATTGITKLDIVNYYLDASRSLILPHLVERPVSLVRAPDGLAGQLVFQSHAGALRIPELRELDPTIAPDLEPMVEVDSFTALIGAAQANVIEFHTWNATARDIERTRPHDLRPRPRRRRRLAQDAGGGAAGAFAPRATRPPELPQDERRQGAARRGAARAAARLGHGEGLLASHRRAPGGDDSRALRRQERAEEPRRPHLRRLPAQRPRRDHRRAPGRRARARGSASRCRCAWDELGTITSGAHWTIRDVHERIEERGDDPWRGYAQARRQSAVKAKKAMGVERAAA